MTFASLLIFFGRLADRFGRKLLFLIGVVTFVLSSVLVAASDSSITLILARAIQGIGASMILPASLSVINAVFVGKSRAVAFAVWGGTIGGMAAVGPLVGGWLTTYASWHWAFLINVPIGIMVIIGVLLVVPETRDITGRKGFDIPGTILITLGLVGIVFAVIEGQRYGWIKPIADFKIGNWVWPLDSVSVVLVAGLLGIIALIAMLVVEKRRIAAGKIVILDLRLFRIKSFGAGNAVALVVSLGEFGLLFAIPLFLQATQGYDALQTGFILLALAIGSFVASGAGAPLSQRMGPVRVLQLGMLLEVIGIAGLGFVSSTQVGAAIGTAIIGTTLIIGLGSTAGHLEDKGVPAAQAEQISDAVASSAGQAIPALAQQPQGDVLVAGATEGFVTAIKEVSLVAGVMVFLGLLLSFVLPKNAARVESEGYEAPKSEQKDST